MKHITTNTIEQIFIALIKNLHSPLNIITNTNISPERIHKANENNPMQLQA